MIVFEFMAFMAVALCIAEFCKQCVKRLRWSTKELILSRSAEEWANGEFKKYCSQRFRKDKQSVLELIEILNQRDYSYRRITVLQYLSPKLQDDKEVVLQEVKKNGSLLQYVSDRLRDDMEVVAVAMSNDISALRYASERLKSDKELIMHFVSKSVSCLEYASQEVRADKDVMLSADWKMAQLSFAAEDIKVSGGGRLVAVNNCVTIVNYVAEALWDDCDFVLEVISRCSGGVLEYVSKELRSRKEIVLAAVSRSGWALRYAADSLQDDKQVVLAAVQENGLALQYASNRLKKDQEVAAACTWY